MGTDDFFKKRRAERKARKCEIRQPKINSYLIVTEGEATEPNYFKGISRHIASKYGGVFDVKIPRSDIHGAGRGTMNLVRAAEKYVNRSHRLYSHIWLVFDRDDFEDFDKAIKTAEENGYHAAWSNPSLEYWLYLHFRGECSEARGRMQGQNVHRETSLNGGT